jgi:hypothetical protein
LSIGHLDMRISFCVFTSIRPLLVLPLCVAFRFGVKAGLRRFPKRHLLRALVGRSTEVRLCSKADVRWLRLSTIMGHFRTSGSTLDALRTLLVDFLPAERECYVRLNP